LEGLALYAPIRYARHQLREKRGDGFDQRTPRQPLPGAFLNTPYQCATDDNAVGKAADFSYLVGTADAKPDTDRQPADALKLTNVLL
jgi:hypothetical protein